MWLGTERACSVEDMSAAWLGAIPSGVNFVDFVVGSLFALSWSGYLSIPSFEELTMFCHVDLCAGPPIILPIEPEEEGSGVVVEGC